jgi:Arc/MetJ-type ribon-helix-helix transcriptional regulator
MKTIQTEVPEKLFEGASRLVKEGWFKDENEVFFEAIRRFLESHQSELMSRFIREDIEWGLHGEE